MNKLVLKRVRTYVTALLTCTAGAAGPVAGTVDMAAEGFAVTTVGDVTISASSDGINQVKTNSCATHGQLAGATSGSSKTCTPGKTGGSGAVPL